MHAAAEIKPGAGVKLKIVVVKDAKLKDRYEVIQDLAGELYLYTIRIGHGCLQTPRIALCIQSRERTAGEDHRLAGNRGWNNVLRKHIINASLAYIDSRGLVGLHVSKVSGAWL